MFRHRSMDLSLEKEPKSAALAVQPVTSTIGATKEMTAGLGAFSPLQNAVLAAQQQQGNSAVRRMIAADTVQRAPAGHTTLRSGSSGPDVVDLQNRLNALGAAPQLDPDGAFGGKTRAAVVAFQQSHNLGPDGVVGPMTWAALDAASGLTPVITTTPGTTPTTPGTTGTTPGGTTTKEENPPDGGDVPQASGQRAQVVSNALGEIGKAHARRPGEADPDTGKTTRYGWSDLDRYFTASYGGKDGQYNKILQDDVKFYNGKSTAQSWCGHFSMWALKSAGVPLGNWKIGSGVGSAGGIKPIPKSQAQPGDVGYIDQPFQHHFIVKEIDGNTVHSVDGNSGTDSEVIENTRSMGAITLFMKADALG